MHHFSLFHHSISGSINRHFTPQLMGLLLLCATSLLAVSSFGQTLPPNFTSQSVVSGLSNPTVSVFAPDGRIFVGQQTGQLRVVKDGGLLANPFISLTVDSNGERGLLGIAFDPNFTSNKYIYLYYTVPSTGGTAAHNRVSRFTANGDVAVPGSESIVLELNDLSTATNHNGGSLAFGPDGKLYVSVGENANRANSQTLDNYLGKVLRINPDGSVPSGNPFTGGSASRQRIWAYGLRNPFNITFQPGTGRFFVNDVGEGTWEEINDATAGSRNFGWPTAEGVCTTPTCATLTNPVYAYQHGSGDGKGCSITGGAFYNPTVSRYPSSYVGDYFFMDYCNGWMNTLDLSGTTAVRSPFITSIPNNNLSVMLGPDGNIYYLNRASGNQSKIFKVVYLGETCTTTKAGSWQDSSVWSCGHVPIIADKAIVGHVVTIANSQQVKVNRVQYVAGGRITLNINGKLQLGL